MCKKGGKVRKSGWSMRKRLFSEGESCSLFSDSEIFCVDRRSAAAQIDLTALSPLPAESPAAILSHSWTSVCTPCCTSCQRQLPSTWWPSGFHSRHRCRCCSCWTTSHSWHCSLRMVFGNPKAGFRSGMPPSQSLS